MSFNLSLEERKDILARHLLDITNFYYELSIKSGRLPENKKTVIFLDGLTPAQVIYMAHRNKIKHILQNSFQPITEKLEVLKKMDLDYMSYYYDEFEFIANIEKKEIFSFSFKADRTAIITVICNHFGIDPAASRSLNFVRVLEELVLNVQVNEAHIKMANAITNFKVIVQKSAGLIAVAVCDPFGDLKIERVLTKIESSITIGTAQSINYGKGGAGLGASIVFELADSMYIGCAPANKTKVAAVLPWNVSEKKMQLIQKSLNIVKTENSF